MRDDICTIPISEAFEQQDGCPLCRMRRLAEKKLIDFIMGPAMMEPDVRISTNELGFCREHYENMRAVKNRLSLALMLDSHLGKIGEDIFGEGKTFKPNDKKIVKRMSKLSESCFVCDKLDFGMEQMMSTIYVTFEKEKDFRTLFDAQPMFCLPHARLLVEHVPPHMNKRWADDFKASVRKVTLDYLKSLNADVHHFCEMFDYRNSGEDADWGNSRDSIERAVDFLTSERKG